MILTATVTSNLKDQIAALSAISDDFTNRVRLLVEKNAIDLANNAQYLVPVSSGELRRDVSKPTFLNGGFTAVVGSPLPYAARQEYDETLNHSVRTARVRQRNTKMGKPGSIIQGTNQENPNATFGFLRKSLAIVSGFFEQDLQALCDKFGRAFRDGEL